MSYLSITPGFLAQVNIYLVYISTCFPLLAITCKPVSFTNYLICVRINWMNFNGDVKSVIRPQCLVIINLMQKDHVNTGLVDRFMHAQHSSLPDDVTIVKLCTCWIWVFTLTLTIMYHYVQCDFTIKLIQCVGWQSIILTPSASQV